MIKIKIFLIYTLLYFIKTEIVDQCLSQFTFKSTDNDVLAYIKNGINLKQEFSSQ